MSLSSDKHRKTYLQNSLTSKLQRIISTSRLSCFENKYKTIRKSKKFKKNKKISVNNIFCQESEMNKILLTKFTTAKNAKRKVIKR